MLDCIATTGQTSRMNFYADVKTSRSKCLNIFEPQSVVYLVTKLENYK